MKLVDANVLIYAVNSASNHHERSRSWLEGALSGSTTVGFSWAAMLAFVRLTTKASLFASPLLPAQALDHIDSWLAQPPAVLIEPTARHASLLRELLESTPGGNLVTDAHLAALAIEHRATIVTFDSDFARFPGVDWELPGS